MKEQVGRVNIRGKGKGGAKERHMRRDGKGKWLVPYLPSKIAHTRLSGRTQKQKKGEKSRMARKCLEKKGKKGAYDTGSSQGEKRGTKTGTQRLSKNEKVFCRGEENGRDGERIWKYGGKKGKSRHLRGECEKKHEEMKLRGTETGRPMKVGQKRKSRKERGGRNELRTWGEV